MLLFTLPKFDSPSGLYVDHPQKPWSKRIFVCLKHLRIYSWKRTIQISPLLSLCLGSTRQNKSYCSSKFLNLKEGKNSRKKIVASKWHTYIYILSSTDRLFRCITARQLFRAGIETWLFSLSSIYNAMEIF